VPLIATQILGTMLPPRRCLAKHARVYRREAIGKDYLGPSSFMERDTRNNDPLQDKNQAVDLLLARFGPNTWSKDTTEFAHPLLPFTGPEPSCFHPYGWVP
jgi:hypothetical protein